MKYTILHRLDWVDPILDGASHMLWMHLLCSPWTCIKLHHQDNKPYLLFLWILSVSQLPILLIYADGLEYPGNESLIFLFTYFDTWIWMSGYGNAWIGICYHLSTLQKFFLTPQMSSHDIIGLDLVTLPDIRVYKKDPSLFLGSYWNLS